ncbi:MAG TPA: hypothetical protein VGW76_02560 [Pyrinomonadaceae bacterium]|nr:hypothetical protein [Pyrinomonadaceae bacterium]
MICLLRFCNTILRKQLYGRTVVAGSERSQAKSLAREKLAGTKSIPNSYPLAVVLE